jgi:hypothetical protein
MTDLIETYEKLRVAQQERIAMSDNVIAALGRQVKILEEINAIQSKQTDKIIAMVPK